MSGFCIKNCLTEASLGWNTFKNKIEIEIFLQLTINLLEIFYVYR